MLLIEGEGAIQRRHCQSLDRRPVALPRQPFRDLLVFRIVDRRVEDPVNRRGRNAAAPKHASRLVGRGEDRQRPAIPSAPRLVIAGDDLHAGRYQSLVEPGEQQRLARPGLPRDGHHLRGSGRVGREGSGIDVDAGARQHRGDPLPGTRLISGEGGQTGAHWRSLDRPARSVEPRQAATRRRS